MKKALKVLGTIIGGYAILNALTLAFIGGGRIVRHVCDSHPEKSILGSDAEVINEAVNDYKYWFDRIRGRA